MDYYLLTEEIWVISWMNSQSSLEDFVLSYSRLVVFFFIKLKAGVGRRIIALKIWKWFSMTTTKLFRATINQVIIVNMIANVEPNIFKLPWIFIKRVIYKSDFETSFHKMNRSFYTHSIIAPSFVWTLALNLSVTYLIKLYGN